MGLGLQQGKMAALGSEQCGYLALIIPGSCLDTTAFYSFPQMGYNLADCIFSPY